MISLDSLNPQQKEIVQTTEGPLLVLAGAGSGKTRSIIFRTAYLILEKKVNPYNILIVTFTNKAAKELQHRLRTEFSVYNHKMWVGTFHSICVRILRRESEFLKVNSSFTIYDSGDKQQILKKIIKKLNIETKTFPVNKVASIISKQKNSLISPEEFFNFNDDNFYTKTISKIYFEYQKILVQNNALDFDDLLMQTDVLLYNHKEIREKYASIFQYMMIDEYQDTNFAQFKFANLLASSTKNICVVGDDDQAIYSWRGADIRNILQFEKDYKNVKKIFLKQNYRSTNSILDLANSLITHNKQRHAKELWSDKEKGEIPRLATLDNEYEEADFVIDEVKKLVKEYQSDYNEIAVLYRTNSQSRVLENQFIKEGLPYRIIGGLNFLQRKEIKDVLSYLRVLDNHDDNESFLRVINFPKRGIGNVTIGKIIEYSVMEGLSLFNYFMQSDLSKYFSKAIFTRFEKLKKQFNTWISLADSLDLLVDKIVSGLDLVAMYEKSKDPKDISRAENVKEFVLSAKEFKDRYFEENDENPDLSDYLQNVSLQTDYSVENKDNNSVNLLTIHNSKGLEFTHVLIVGLEDGLLPHKLSITSENKEFQIEEERRLLYVAMTRAKLTLTLSYGRWRHTFDGYFPSLPSRFLGELDSEKIQSTKNQFYEIQSPRTTQKKFKKKVTLESYKHFKIGQQVTHNNFGKGVILNVEGSDENAKLTISFKSGKLKKILGSFIKLI